MILLRKDSCILGGMVEINDTFSAILACMKAVTCGSKRKEFDGDTEGRAKRLYQLLPVIALDRG